MTSLRALLSGNIRKRRKFLALSQAKLAEKVETSTHYIAQIEQMNKFPSVEMLERIAAALEMDSPELFTTQVFSEEALKSVQDLIQADIDEMCLSVKKRVTDIKIIKD